MELGAGALNRRIGLEISTVTASDLGGEVEAWSLIGDRWARIRYGRAEERRAAAAEGSAQTALFVIRRDGVTAALTTRDRVIFDGWQWDIEGVARFGEGFLELACVARTERTDG